MVGADAIDDVCSLIAQYQRLFNCASFTSRETTSNCAQIVETRTVLYRAASQNESVEVIQSIKETGVIVQSGIRGPSVPKLFMNDGRGGGQLLPAFDRGKTAITYREWGTVPSAGSLKPGAERIVTGSNGSIYYSPDHYRTFIRWQ